MMIEALCDSWYVCGWLVMTVLACIAIASTFVMRDPADAAEPRSKGSASQELKLKAPPIASRPEPYYQQRKSEAASQRPRPATTAKMPKPEKQLALIRLHIVALDQAIQANDFRVLHAISAPRLRNQMTAEQLAWAFESLTVHPFDGAAAIAATPHITKTPKLLPGNVLNIVGYLPTPRQRIDFHMQFQRTDRRWQLLAMNVATGPAQHPHAETKACDASKTRRKREKAKQVNGAIIPRRRRH